MIARINRLLPESPRMRNALPSRLLAWLMITLILVVSHRPSRAGIIEEFGSLGSCTLQGPLFKARLLNSLQTDVRYGDGSFLVTVIDNYEVTWFNQNPPSTFTCQESYSVRYKNEPYGPGMNSKREVILLLIYGRIRTKQIPVPSFNTPNKQPYIIKQPPQSTGGIRGSLDGNFFGLDLVEASPVFFIFSETLSQAEAQTNRYVPLMVESKGDEDWLELSVNGTNYFKQSLAEFETNRWYEVDVPLGSLVEGENTYAFFLNSTGAANSRIFFPLGEPQDRPPKIAEFTVTNSSLSLTVSNLIKEFDYAVEQTTVFTNWQQTKIFTATNKFQTVTLPMTNSASFYRVALPPQ